MGLGGMLRGSGSAHLTSDQLVLTATQTPNAAAVYFQGTASVAQGAGLVFGDGLRCAGGTLVRIGMPIAAGNQSQSPGPGESPISLRGAVTTPGPRRYQVGYRDPPGFCTAGSFNLTNGLIVTWAP